MIPIRQFDALLQTQSLNNKMFQTLVQGSEDTAIKATIQQDGKNIQIDTGAEIELSVLYNGGTTQTYHTDKAKSDFPATIESDGTLIIKFNEMMTTVFGTHKLFLKIVDTNTSYALAMDYTVIKNEAYNPQSTPNNLPAYNTLVAELPKKLNKDFSNADDVALKNKLSTLGIGADETPEQIRDKLQTLKADDRLDSSAVKDCLTTDLADVDLDKLDEKFQATDSGKILQQNSQAIGTKANADLSNVSNEDLDSLLVQTDMGKQILDNTKQVQTKLDTDMGNVNTLLFSREMKLTGAYQDLANRPSGQGRTAEQIKALFEANRFEEQAAVDFSDPQFSSTTLYMAYQFTTNNQTITQELPSVADGQIIMVEALLSSGITNPTLTFTAKAGDTIKPEFYVGEFQAKAFTRVHLKIEPVFANEEVIPVGANTQICLQSITKDESSGLALLSFMAFTGYKIGFDTLYYGFNSLNLARFLVFDQPQETVSGEMPLGDNTFINFATNSEVQVSGYNLIIENTGLELPVWNIYKVYSEYDCQNIGGKNALCQQMQKGLQLAYTLTIRKARQP